jgi:hypothetical protein
MHLDNIPISMGDLVEELVGIHLENLGMILVILGGFLALDGNLKTYTRIEHCDNAYWQVRLV